MGVAHTLLVSTVNMAAPSTWASFAALRHEYGTRSNDELAKIDVAVKGQLMHMRRLSRKCSFYDLESTDASEADQRIEVILKIIQDELSIEQVETIRHRVNVGDVVVISGFLEKTHTSDADGIGAVASFLLHVRDMTVVTAWKDASPGVPFQPRPTAAPKKSGSATNVGKETSAVGSASSGEQTPGRAVAHCKFWINSRTCHLGDKCELVHIDDANFKAARAQWLEERLQLKRSRAQLDDDPHDAHGKTSKSKRAEVFVDWLVKQFGVETLSTGVGVVDVAGGRGNVSFELWNKRGIPCTLIDPRPMKLSKVQMKHLKKVKKNTTLIAGQELAPQRMELFNTESFLEKPANEQLIREASVLIGMHPDEATDAIFDMAVKFDKSFAVVPCCVFGRTFPDRRVSSDPEKRVVSFDDFVEYLQAKHTSIEKAFLPFDGKNMVLFRSTGSTITAVSQSNDSK
ncbi:TPA: hypothetical protein N0F65_004472 [Lagenidium giganteum]|uniref:C3H1-type domain-containing protein n=1 Tax=Lagenidium giganteum TaxID=4803 RepID=A0AAV2ZP49_9STRA|nr:TPA: hypothetical protein N0F65_004472 [Lagenidium giganteum]